MGSDVTRFTPDRISPSLTASCARLDLLLVFANNTSTQYVGEVDSESLLHAREALQYYM